jgi:3-oxoacyl-[acyl-carrier protein] reductase
MTSGWHDRVALVTGASRGIGRAIAVALGRRGVSVALNYRSPIEAEEAAEAVSEIAGLGGKATAIEADLADMAQIGELFDQSIAALGRPDFVISNVGGIVAPRRIADFDEAHYDLVTTLNAKSAFFVLSRAAREVRDGGRIVAISSSTTTRPYAGTAAYAGSKAALEAYCAVLAHELGERRITVNSVAPGLTQTEGMMSAPPPQARIREVEAATPLGRLGEAADIADSVMMLLGDEAHWITGQAIRAGGGFH